MIKKYSGKRIEKAGKILAGAESLDYSELSDQMDVLSYWRYCHERPLNEAFSIIQSVVAEHDDDAIYARRLKRSSSIISKLKRFDSMSLKNMQDIGGCRAIVSSEKKLQRIVRKLKKRKEFKTATGQVRAKDYLKKPKEDGYRSYHIIGKFKDDTGEAKSIEIQVRTLIHHYWATALEIVDIFTGQALKSNQGDKEWHLFFRLVADQFAAMDKIHLFHSLPINEQFQKYSNEVHNSDALLRGCSEVQTLSKKLKVTSRLQAYAGSLKVINDQIIVSERVGYILLNMDMKKSTVTVNSFEKTKSEEAEKQYISAEISYATTKNNIVALVSTSNIGDIKEAYPNFFADSSLFAKHLKLIENIQFGKGVLEKLLESTPRMKR